jgi:hypothetical protein
VTDTTSLTAGTMDIHVFYLRCGHVQWARWTSKGDGFPSSALCRPCGALEDIMGHESKQVLDVPQPAAENCGICDKAPEDSGAQYDMATVTWDDVTVKVCSNCVHGNPVSIVDLHKATRRAAPAQEGDPA